MQLLTVENARSEAQVAEWGGRASASANAVSVSSVAGDVGVLTSSCRVDSERCRAQAQSGAVDVSLLGGRVVVAALESEVDVDCMGNFVQETRFSSLVIDGHDHGSVVHPSVIVIPGVAIVTVGATDETVTYSARTVSATALRIDLLNVNGQSDGVIVVGHSAVSVPA